MVSRQNAFIYDECVSGLIICRYVPSEADGGPKGTTDPYWKTKTPGEKGWDRYTTNGEPITADEAHPGPSNFSESQAALSS